jgi:predicted acetyltransferase
VVGRQTVVMEPRHRPTIRLIEEDEFPAWVASVSIPFLEPVHDPAERADRVGRFDPFIDRERAWVVEDDGRFVGNAAVFDKSVTLPGPPGGPCPLVPFAAISEVGVHATHRRRGLLRRLMGTMLDDARARGDVLAGLTASDGGIYGRYGFGWAVNMADYAVWTRDSAFAVPAPDVELRMVGGPEVSGLVSAAFDRAIRGVPGQVDRSAFSWTEMLADRAADRGGASALSWVVCDGGVASWRNRLMGEGADRWGRTIVEDLVAETPEIEAALWRFLLDLDLPRELVAYCRPVDEPIRHRLADPRQLRTTRIRDFLWLRVLDTPGALTARGYLRAGRLVLDVAAAPSSPTGPDGLDGPDPAVGRWVLEAGPDGASCVAAPTGVATDLRLGLADLGAILAGGVRATTLGAAGRVREERPGALVEADAFFAAERDPFCLTGF